MAAAALPLLISGAGSLLGSMFGNTGAGNQALANANQYGSNAAAIGAGLNPGLFGRVKAPPGYGAALPGMLSGAVAGGNAIAGQARNRAMLRAMRTGNFAGQQAVDTGAAQAGSQATTGAIENVLGKNAMLQASQQDQALRELGGLYGTSAGAQTRLMGLYPGLNLAGYQNPLAAAGMGMSSAGLQGLAGIFGKG